MNVMALVCAIRALVYNRTSHIQRIDIQNVLMSSAQCACARMLIVFVCLFAFSAVVRFGFLVLSFFVTCVAADVCLAHLPCTP